MDSKLDAKVEQSGDEKSIHAARLYESVGFDEARAKKLKWKIDLRILPVICVTYALQGVDKTTLGYAAVYGMREDLHLVGAQYSWAGSIFYFGYLAAQFPTNLMLQRFPVNRCMSATVRFCPSHMRLAPYPPTEIKWLIWV